MLDKFSFFVEKDSKLILNEHKMEIFIPKYYFEQDASSEKELSFISGTKMDTIGIFYFKIYKNDKDKGTLYNLNIPINIVLNVYEIEEDVEIAVAENYKDTFTILTYDRDDVIIPNVNIIVDADSSIMKFMRLLQLGKLPSSIPYDKLLETFFNATEASGIKIDVNSTIIEIILAESNRLKKDLTKPFRLIAGKGNYDDKDRKLISLVEIPRVASTFTGLVFERISQSIISGINNNRLNRRQDRSPLEDTIRY